MSVNYPPSTHSDGICRERSGPFLPRGVAYPRRTSVMPTGSASIPENTQSCSQKKNWSFLKKDLKGKKKKI